MIVSQDVFDKKITIEDQLPEQNLTIPREPGGGTGTMAS